MPQTRPDREVGAPPFPPEPCIDLSLGDGWAGNSVNCVPFRSRALLRTGGHDIVAFFDPDGQVVVVAMRDGVVRARTTLSNGRMPFDAHQAISLGVDPLGRVHVAFGAHNSTLLTARTAGSDVAAGFGPVAEHHHLDPVTGTVSGSLTYPMFLRTPDELVLLYRCGSHTDGTLQVSRLDETTGGWIPDPIPLVSGRSGTRSCGPYLNSPVVTQDGSIHCFLVWRLPVDATGAGAVVNVGLDGFMSTDRLRSVRTMRGVDLQLPVTPANIDRLVPIGPGSSLINQACAGRFPGGQAAAISYWDPEVRADGKTVPQYRIAWPSRAGWRSTPVSSFSTAFSPDGGGTLPLPHSRPELLFDDAGRALVVSRSSETGNRLMVRILLPPDYALADAVDQVLVDEDLGFYEPVVSHDAWNEQRLLLVYGQRCEQARNRDGKPDRAAAPVWLRGWQLDAALTPRRHLTLSALPASGSPLATTKPTPSSPLLETGNVPA